MIHVCFQNGVEGPEILLEEEFETEADAKEQLERLAHAYGTVDGAVAWVEGTKKPKSLEVDEDAEDLVPADSRLKEHVITAPPSPEVEAAAAEAAALAEAEEAAVHAQAVADNFAAHEAEAKAKADAEKAEAEKKAAPKKKTSDA